MNKIKIVLLGLISIISPFILGVVDQTIQTGNTYKCMVQLTNYTGEGAYVTVSLVDKANNYIKTLRVLGDDEDWYPDLTSWFEFHDKGNDQIDGITGASISAGKRAIFQLAIPSDKMDAGYKLRFETAVEDREYYERDLEIPLINDKMKGKFGGNGYIRYVRLLPK